MAENTISSGRLYIFSGLPASGKTTLARRLAAETGACFLRIDTVEQGMRDILGVALIRDEGYRLAYRIAEDNLALGNSVIADSCNPVEITRMAWQGVAEATGARWVNIEIFCSDGQEHRSRAEKRVSSIPGLVLPDWEQIRNRTYLPWAGDCIRVDTAGRSEAEAFAILRDALAAY